MEVPDGLGDLIARNVLRAARETANRERLLGSTSNEVRYFKGICIGRILVARHWLHAEHVALRSAANEVRYLLGRYLDEAAADRQLADLILPSVLLDEGLKR